MISALIEVGKKWQDANYPLRKKAIQIAAPEFCLSSANFELALSWIFSFWNQEILLKLQDENRYKNISNVVQVLAGNTPAVIAQAFLHGALINVPQVIKIPSLQPTFPKLLYDSFNETFSELGALFQLDAWENNRPEFYSKLSKSDLVIAYGSDETIALLKNYCSQNTIFLPQGHAVSCAIIFKASANRDSLEKLAWDMLSYDQRGCLSPRVVFVEKGGELSPFECASVFSNEILPAMAQQFPRGGLFPGEAAAILQKSALYRFRGVVYSGVDWTVCYDDQLIWPEEALPRFLPFKPFSTFHELDNVLQHVENHLISIGCEGNDNTVFNYPQLKHICHLGEMQKQLLWIENSSH
jgi:hypothetical protein